MSTENTKLQTYKKESVNFEQKNTHLFYLYMKRLIDIFGSLIGICITSIIMAFLFVFYIVGEHKGPMFYKQKRIGKYGKKFYIYKFRSMIVNAEEKLVENEVLYKKYINNNFKLEQDDDPRITKIGRFLRRTSLDEFPQFFNVLKGEMSLVGPRPTVEEELKYYNEKIGDFLSVKPGVTGYWQASGRSNIGYPRRVDIELYYIYNQSLALDIKILFKTIIQVVKRKGAY